MSRSRNLQNSILNPPKHLTNIPAMIPHNIHTRPIRIHHFPERQIRLTLDLPHQTLDREHRSRNKRLTRRIKSHLFTQRFVYFGLDPVFELGRCRETVIGGVEQGADFGDVDLRKGGER
jgi:hypothetical protein